MHHLSAKWFCESTTINFNNFMIKQTYCCPSYNLFFFTQYNSEYFYEDLHKFVYSFEDHYCFNFFFVFIFCFYILLWKKVPAFALSICLSTTNLSTILLVYPLQHMFLKCIQNMTQLNWNSTIINVSAQERTF